jgi:uncharacterized protein (DUF2141 family)
MIRKLISLTVVAAIYACATVQSPTGGEKDEIAPILYESNPENQSTNFKGTEITLFFNEWMQLDQLPKELIITPREEIEFESELNKQELTITLEKPLQDSTTYTFNFRKSLKDITEGNLWENPVIAFSTGPFLDSLAVSGTVYNIANNKPQEKFLVGLYSNEYDTANLRQGKPTYFTTTDENGYFQMQNLKAGTYKLYTFKDGNDNLINESTTEPFGFHSTPLDLSDSIAPLTINTYLRNEDTLKLKKYSPTGKDFVVQYNKGLSSYQIFNPMDSNQYIYANDIENSKYLKIYKENFPTLDYESDSLLLLLTVEDSIQTRRTDTVYFKLRESRLTNDSIRIVGKPEGKVISGSQQFEITLSKPVATIITDSVQLRLDTIPIQKFSKENFTFNQNKKTVTLNMLLEQKNITQLVDSLAEVRNSQQNDSTRQDNNDERTKADSTTTAITTKSTTPRGSNGSTNNSRPTELQLYIGKSAFIGIEKDSTKQTSIPISFKNIEDHGIIKGEIIQADFPFVIELLNKEYEVVDTLINRNQYQFNYVKPGDYRIRLLIDKNANNSWDAGNPFLLQKEEEYVYLDEVITVKANWEVIDKNFDFSVDNEVDNGEEGGDL